MGLMFRFQNLVEGMVVSERDTLTKLGATVQGLRETADEYASIDANTAAEMDKIAPRGQRAVPGRVRGRTEMAPTATVGFADTMHPLGRLNPPGNYDELVTDSVTDVLPGVVGWINDAVAWATRQFGHEVNVVHWLTETVGGDWDDLLSLADAWNNLAWASQDIAANLTAGVAELDPSWDGNASKAFTAHMVKWHNAFAENGWMCETVRDRLRGLAAVAKEFLQATIDMVQMILSILGSGGPVVAVLRWRRSLMA